MSDTYERLIDASIGYLQKLKSRGVQFVRLSPDILKGLTQPSASPAHDTRRARAKESAAPARQVMSALSRPSAIAQSGEPEPPSPADLASPAEKNKAMAELRERASGCMKCAHLASSRRNVVFGVGDVDARLMFVGEAPGMDEDAQGEPFVGKAGELLTRIIQTMGLGRDRVYIANILKCRPDTPGQRTGNRKPTPDEMRTCIPYLHAQIEVIQPKVMVALGATAIEGLLGKTAGITRLRGQWQTYRGIPLMPTYHPAYLLRNEAPAEKRRVWEDMLQVMEKLDMPITEKQRGYFQR